MLISGRKELLLLSLLLYILEISTRIRNFLFSAVKAYDLKKKLYAKYIAVETQEV